MRNYRRDRDADLLLSDFADLPVPDDGKGHPLDAGLRDDLSRSFGYDLSRIRLHHDWFAAELTAALDAVAVTHGDDIYFAPGYDDHTTPAGRALLVHELFHAAAGSVLTGSAPHHEEEVNAERSGSRASRGGWASIPLRATTAGSEAAPATAGASDTALAGALEPAKPGRWSRLARRTKPTLLRTTADGEVTPDIVSAGDALVRLIDRLLSRDPADRGGRLAALLGRLEQPLRDAVVTKVIARNGGHTAMDLYEVGEDRPPQDGGYAEPSIAIPEDTEDTAGSSDLGTSAERSEPAPSDGGFEGAGTTAEEAPGPDVTARAQETQEDLEGEPPPDDQPPAVPTLTAPAVDESRAAAAAGGPGIVAGPSAPGPEVPSAAEARVEAAPLLEESAAALATGATAGEAPPAAAPIGETPVDETPTEEQSALPDEAGAAPAGGADSAADLGAQSEIEEAARAPGATPAESQTTIVRPGEAPESTSGEVSAATGGAALAPATEQAARSVEAEPQDPTAVTAPPAPEDDTEPSLPEPPGPIVPAASTMAPESVAGEPGMEPVVATADAGEAAEPSEATVGEDVSTATEAIGEGAEAPTSPTEVDAGDVTRAALPQPTPADVVPMLTDPAVPSGGGGGGAAIADPAEREVPDVSAMEPGAALAAISSLPATKLATGLSGVSAAAQRTVSTAQADLATDPPSMERPSGVPADKDASLPPAPLPPLPAAADRSVSPLESGPGGASATPVAPPPAPAPVTAQIPEAKAGGDTQISAEDAARIQSAVRSLPTTDPALDVDAGPVPNLELSGGEDPQRVADQAREVEGVTAGEQRDGLTDARADMGENDVLPQVPKETLTADLGGGEGGGAAAPGAPPGQAGAVATAAPGAPAGAGAAAGATGRADAGAEAGRAGGGAGAAVPAAAIDAVAAEQGADQINASTQVQRSALGAARDEHESLARQAKADTDKQINEEIAGNGTEQTAERRDVRTDVGRDRNAWVGEQEKVADRTRHAADAALTEADSSIDKARTTARTDADKAVRDGNDDIARERQKAEEKAREQRKKAERESDDGGFFSWLGSKVKSFFDGIKKAIHAAFELARKAVDVVISAAQKLAVAAIELGRKAVVAAIEIGGKALAAAGDIVLAGFPEARARFRKKISERVDAAKKKVNELAESLKAGVKKLLDALGAVLKGALTLLEKAYTAAIDLVGKVVDTVIKAVKAWIDTLVDFAMIVADIAAGPVQWVRNLGAGLLDGVRNHVWPSLVTAVKNWFKSKVEEVVGVGKMILDVLRKGGISFGKIVTMTWTAIKESLPGIIIQLLIEKLVAILIPAGGALALIIDGIKAAWGAASKILAAFQKFMAFLKSVKSGNSGPKFGDLVGAAAVAVMDFLANFVLSKLKGAGQKVGGTLRRMAGNLMKVAKKAAGVVKTGAKAAAGAIKRGVVALGRATKKGAAAVLRTAKKVLPKNLVKLGAKAVKYVGTQIKRGVQKLKGKLFGKKKPKETRQEKLARAIERTRATIAGLLARGVSRPRLWATLKWLKLRWRWRELARRSTGADQFAIEGVINPSANVGTGVSTITILHSGNPVAVGTTPISAPTPTLAPVQLGPPHAGRLDQQYASAIIKSRLKDIAETDIGRGVEIPLPGRTVEKQAEGGGSTLVRESRKAGGESSLETARVNPEMSLRKGGPQSEAPFVRPDARTGLVPGVDPATGKRDPSRDSVHLYEITTMMSFVEGNKKLALHKQQQALWTIYRVLQAFPGAKVHYTFISPPPEPDSGTKAVIQQIVTGLSTVDQARFTVTWRTIGWTR